MKPTTREELIDYCLRALGAPVLQINVAPEQLNDRLDEALQFYQHYHDDSMIHHFRKHQLTQDDISQRYIDIPEDMIYITRVLPFGSMGAREAMFSIDYHTHLNLIDDLQTSGGLVHYRQLKKHLSLLSDMFNKGQHQRIRFNRHMNKLYLDTDWDKTFAPGDWIIVEGYTTVNPEEYVEVYNDMFLKRYLTALIKRAWGINLKKFGRLQLVGGVEMDGQTIFSEATDEIRQLEEQVESHWSSPPMGFVG